MSAQQQVHAFESDDHLVPGAAGAEADSLTERAKSIFVESIFIVLTETVFTELSVAQVLFVYFRVVLIAIPPSDHVAF